MSKAKYKNCKIYKIELLIPFGCIAIQLCNRGLHIISFKDLNLKNKIDQNEFNRIELINENDQIDSNQEISQLAQHCIEYFRSYFDSSCNNLDIKICWESFCSKESFTRKVLETLMNEIKFGEKTSYKSLAKLSGNENAQRAVGSTMRRNPMPIVIPCHRVVNTDTNKAGYYSAGIDIKNWLLKFESQTKSK